MTACPHLFRPLAIGPVELRNRIASTSHQTNLVHDHMPTDAFVAYHEARARGGAGLIVMEATAVHESGLLHPHTVAGYLDAIVHAYARVVAAVRPHGTRLFTQLFHGGREQIASPPRPPAVAPSAVPTSRFKTEPRALRCDEVEGLIAGYGRAAALAAEGGLDGVEISAAHNYLIPQFFTPALNRRSDRWAAGPAFLLAVLDAVRAAAPSLAVGVRLSADSSAAQAVATDIAGRVDYLGLTVGESSTYRGSVHIVPPPPVPQDVVAGFTESFRVGPPILATGRIVDPRAADRMVSEGRADAVGMTRALIADPDLPRKLREDRIGDVLRCIGCNACIAHYHAGTPIGCAQNPRTGRERTLPRPSPARARLRLAVVGGGPAGLAAAAEGRSGGHDAVLLERSDRIGGQMALAAGAPANAETAAALVANYERLLAGADVRLGVEAGADTVAALEPDAVVVATGARPFDPDLALAGVEVLSGWDVLAGARPGAHAVVVADWGGDSTGPDCAELLADAGFDVVLACAAVVPGEAMHQYRRNLALARLYRARVRIEHHVELLGAGPGAVTVRNLFAPELRTEIPAGALVLALGRVPESSPGAELRERGLRVEEAGDCLSPRSLEEAILEGTLAARRALATSP